MLKAFENSATGRIVSNTPDIFANCFKLKIINLRDGDITISLQKIAKVGIGLVLNVWCSPGILKLNLILAFFR